MFAPSDVVREEEEGLELDLCCIVNVREQHRSERAVEERADRKSWIISFASCGKKDHGFLFVGEMITETVVEDSHFYFFCCVDVEFDVRRNKTFVCAHSNLF